MVDKLGRVGLIPKRGRTRLGAFLDEYFDKRTDVKPSVQGNSDRFFFVTCDMGAKVLDACPDSVWRLIFALCRYGGLRCPSEVQRLRLRDVDWGRDEFLVHAPKTEHHEGKATRWVPIFPELRPYMEDVWPKVFQNLRSSRQIELEERFPSHVVCAWLGNSVQVARKHYLQVTDEHFARALQNPMHEALQNSVQQTAAIERTKETRDQKALLLAVQCRLLRLIAFQRQTAGMSQNDKRISHNGAGRSGILALSYML